MDVRADDFKTPGQLLDACLKRKGWTKRILAVVLGMDETAVNRIMTDKRAVTAELALSIEEVLGIPAAELLSLQQAYDLAKARITARPDPGRSTRAQLIGELPITEMIRRGWLPEVTDVRDVAGVETALKKFFDAPSLEEIEILPNAAKKTNVASDVTPVQLAWLYRVRAIASEMLVARYSPAAGKHAVDRISSLLAAPEEARKVPRILAEAGIRFVLVETLPNAKIDGVTLWLNDFAPVIGMTARFDRIDNFYFVLRHEMEHVLRGHGRTVVMLDAELEGERAGTGPSIPEEERLANAAAADFCVPQGKLAGFIARKAPFFAERDILGFARTLNIHPGLVAGQLQHRTNRYDRFRQHLAKVRDIVRPSAIVDGWGDVAPVGL